MENEFKLSAFTKSMLTGLFVGIMATLVCLVFNIIYREKTGFPLSEIINVSSLIFFVNLLFLVIGMIFYLFLKAFRGGHLLFVLVSLLISAFLAWKSLGVHRSDDPQLNREFHGLLEGVVIILGIGASVFIPLLYFNRKFEKNVL
ncbi:MAG TPA: hypothetical protein VG870_03415 [Chitinophagaceae bacterium]|nr:hypothetical protein [Chitinophagaceae bacterium]